MIKKVGVVLLVLTLALGMVTMAEGKTINEKADFLNQLKILQGSDSGYELEGKLTRAQAATFIVRVLGKENEVISNANAYKVTKFPDVPQYEWYAHYVGYCAANEIVHGYDDGTYKPDNILSEQEFLTMMLNALGYGEADFTWEEVFSAAYEKGLVSDIQYTVKVTDEGTYYRKQVVEAIYNSMNLNKKNGEKMFRSLIDNNVVSFELFRSLGWIKTDGVKTTVSSSKLVDNHTFEITLSESVKAIKLDQVSIVDSSDSSKLQVKDIKLSNNVITLDTAEQLPGKTYKCTLTGLMDLDDNPAVVLESQFTTAETPVVESPYFMIKEIEAVSNKSINVYFTHPIGAEADFELLYDFYNNEQVFVQGGFRSLGVSRIAGVDNGISITLKEKEFVISERYELRIREDLQSSYGVYIKTVNAKKAFIAASKVVEAIKVTEITNTGGNYFKVEFSKSFDRTMATNKDNYVLKNRDTGKEYGHPTNIFVTENAETDDKEVIVTYTGLVDNKIYDLHIKNIKDRNLTEKIDDTIMTVIAVNKYDFDLNIDLVTAVDRTTILVYFDKPLHEISENASVSLNGSSIFIKKDIDPKNAQYMYLYLPKSLPMTDNATYKLRFTSGLRGYDLRTLVDPVEYVFAGDDDKKKEITIEKALFIDDTIVRIDFNQKIDKDTAMNVSHYELKYMLGDLEKLIIPKEVKVYNNQTVIIKLDKVYDGGKYELKVMNMKDYSEQYIKETETSIIDRLED